MSKVYNYMFIAVGLTILLKLAGIPSGADGYLVWLGLSGDISNISSGAFFGAVAAVFVIGGAAGIAISYFTRTPGESYVIASLAAGVFSVIVGTFVSILTYTKDMGFIYSLMYLIFVPFIVAFGIAIIQFWRGSD